MSVEGAVSDNANCETEHTNRERVEVRNSNRNKNRKNVLYTNADSLNNKMAELNAIADVENVDIICVTETLPKNIVDRAEYVNMELEGYIGYHSNTGRGVSIYVRENIKCELIKIDIEYNDNIWVKITMNNNCKVLIGCIYRSPNSDQRNNDTLLRVLQAAMNVNSTNKIIVGDFNYKEVDWVNGIVHSSDNHPASKMFDKLNDLFLNQLVTSPTRYREGENANLLDWVITDNPDIIDDLSLNPPLGEKGDHCIILFKIDITCDNVRYGDLLNYYQANYEGMKNKLKDIDWDEKLISKSVEESWKLFLDILKALIEKFIPKRKCKKRKSQPWINQEIKIAIKEKNRVWKRYKKEKSIENWEMFKNVRNATNKIIFRQKCAFEQKIAMEIGSNPKQFWNYIRSKSKKQHNFPDMITTEGTILTEDNDKANHFNNYFASVFTEEDRGEIPQLEQRIGDNSLSNVTFSPESVELQLKKLNTSKAAGPDKLHAKVLFELREHISTPLSIIYNKSMSEGKLPNDWKLAYVKPLHKKGNRNLVSNYRPVSLTAICCKTMERLIRTKLINFLEDNKLLSKDQHGFRNGRSCVTQLLEIMELWTSFLDNGLSVDCIYLDFAKAFDKVPHLRLVNKLKAYGIKDNLIKWLTDFVTDRKQKVIINGSTSNMESVRSGIPQGSVLGPSLFVIFINDLPDIVNTYVKIFADDTKIFNAIKSNDDILILQEDIDKLVEWSIKWQLPFNMDKTKVIHYGTRNTAPTYFIDGNIVNKEDTEKDLGINFDKNLKFSPHIATIVNKANSRLGIIKRNFSNHTKELILPLYKALVRPILEYGSTIWCPMLRGDIIEVEKVQKRATKMISEVSNMSYENRLMTLRLDSLAFRRRRNDMLQIFRIINKIDNIDIANYFELQTDSMTRGHTYKFKKPHINSRIRQNTFAIRVINDWNKLKNETVTSKTLNAFKTNLADEWDNHPERFFET